jgi:predicted AlkP superfamily phosphohydrolase/phosphomutase
MTSTILFGLDGATFDVLDDLVTRGVMRYLGRFMADGARGTLMSTVPPLTPIAWSSLVTGRTPGNHGVTGFFQHASGKGHGLQIVSSRQLQAETIWSVASRQGVRALSLNFVVHQPPPRIDGSVIPGWVPWRWLKRFSHPPRIVERLARELPSFDIKQLAMDFDEERKAVSGAPLDECDPWIRLHVNRDRQWFEVFRHLLTVESYGLAGIVFDGVDKLQHLLWRYLDPSLEPASPSREYVRTRESCWRYFAQLDTFLAETVSFAGRDATIFIVSDHGFTGCRDIVFINTWLEQRGYLTWKSDVPVIADRGDRDRFDELEPDFYQLSAFDMSRTVAYALTSASNGIHINVRGARGDDGIAPESYEPFRADLVRSLLTECVDPGTGEPLVTAVSLREDAFGGPHMALAPDLTLTLRDHGFVSVRRGRSLLAVRPEIVGTHHPRGVFVARGPNIRPGRLAEPLQLVDVMPTALYATGLAIPPDLDGRVVTEMFQPEHLHFHRVKVARAFEFAPAAAAAGAAPSGQDADVLARMKALGYLE